MNSVTPTINETGSALNDATLKRAINLFRQGNSNDAIQLLAPQDVQKQSEISNLFDRFKIENISENELHDHMYTILSGETKQPGPANVLAGDIIGHIFFLCLNQDEEPLALPFVNKHYFDVIRPLCDRINLSVYCPNLTIVDAKMIQRFLCDMREDLMPERDDLPRLMDDRAWWIFDEPCFNELAVVNFYRKHECKEMMLCTIFKGKTCQLLEKLASLKKFDGIWFRDPGYTYIPWVLGGPWLPEPMEFDNMLNSMFITHTYRIMIFNIPVGNILPDKKIPSTPCHNKCEIPTFLEFYAHYIYSWVIFKNKMNVVTSCTSKTLSSDGSFEGTDSMLYVRSPKANSLPHIDATTSPTYYDDDRIRTERMACKVLGGEDRPEYRSEPDSSCTLF